jgi:CheY-like chemotaxis protein
MARQHVVLVVDDDRDVRALWGDNLRAQGHEVIEAVDGLHALRLLHDSRLPCLVLADVRMPRLDGWELAQAMSRDPQLTAIPVVLVTADRLLAISSPAGDKPMAADELDSLVERSCALHRRPYNRAADEG